MNEKEKRNEGAESVKRCGSGNAIHLKYSSLILSSFQRKHGFVRVLGLRSCVHIKILFRSKNFGFLSFSFFLMIKLKALIFVC